MTDNHDDLATTRDADPKEVEYMFAQTASGLDIADGRCHAQGRVGDHAASNGRVGAVRLRDIGVARRDQQPIVRQDVLLPATDSAEGNSSALVMSRS